MSSKGTFLGLCGLYVGIFGLIVAASTPYAFLPATFVWLFGWIFFLGAYLQGLPPV